MKIVKSFLEDKCFNLSHTWGHMCRIRTHKTHTDFSLKHYVQLFHTPGLSIILLSLNFKSKPQMAVSSSWDGVLCSHCGQVLLPSDLIGLFIGFFCNIVAKILGSFVVNWWFIALHTLKIKSEIERPAITETLKTLAEILTLIKMYFSIH